MSFSTTWPRVVLFDFDGTLADGYPGITAAVNAVRARYGLGPLAVDTVRPIVGRGLENCLQETVPNVDLAVDVPFYRQVYEVEMITGTSLLPGAEAVVVALRAARLPIGVCSNKRRPFTDSLLQRLGLHASIDVVVGPEDVERSKPAPDMLLCALERLGVGANDALYVGDMTVDIACARGAGVTVWVVPTGSDTRATLVDCQPDRILVDLHELAGMVTAATVR